MKTKLVAILLSLFFLTSCGQLNNGAVGGPSIDFNADIEAIAVGVRKFEENTRQSSNIQTYEDFRSISESNGRILDEIDASTDIFLTNIEKASSELPSEDSTESPSKSKLIAWAEGYKTWVYYQKLNQTIGSECLNYPDDWMNCLITRLPETSQNEQSSTINLTIAIQGIQEWQRLAGQ
jgi:hypothetical protein